MEYLTFERYMSSSRRSFGCELFSSHHHQSLRRKKYVSSFVVNFLISVANVTASFSGALEVVSGVFDMEFRSVKR